MFINTIEQDFIDKVSARVRLVPDGKERFRVLTPFQFDDGDQLVIVLKKAGKRWVLSDEAHTYMHLTYDIDESTLHSGTRREIISRALSMFDVEDHNGELILDVPEESYGDALYDFAQALLKITDVTYLSRERVQSTFFQDMHRLLSNVVGEARMELGWHDPTHDPQGHYSVDCRINGIAVPLFVYALSNDDRTRKAAIALHQFRAWQVPHHSLGIFEHERSTSKQASAQINDVCDKSFVGIDANAYLIEQYLAANI
jgi:hypothetical protein